MPRKGLGPKLWLDESRNSYTIVHGRTRVRTGCTKDQLKEAEAALGEYIAATHKPAPGTNPPIADVLAFYLDEKIADTISAANIRYDLARLNEWWGSKLVSEIGKTTCKAYVVSRNGAKSARRELAFLNAALNCWHNDDEHGPLAVKPKLTLPDKPEPRDKYMTIEQAARFLWQARREPHLARFFLIGWYTGSRRTVIGKLRWDMVDLKTGIMQRKPPGAPKARNKLAPPVKMSRRLLVHMRRWKRLDGKGAEFVVAYRGKPIRRPIRSWERARKAAKLPEWFTPHILRHTRATNLMREGVDIYEAAQALGMSVAVLEKVYAHHRPEWQAKAADVR
jgi:integrase